MEQVLDFFQNLMQADNWPPRWYCGKWTDFHGWLYICSDLAIWAAYFVIPVFLLRLIQKRPGIPFPTVFWLFGAFILLCGLTHLIDGLMFWWPAYRFNGLVRFITAAVSWLTIYALYKIFPLALSLKTAGEFNVELQERHKVEHQLKIHAKDLELKNKEMEQFAYIASHDLQEPLRTISNFSSLLQEKYSAADKETEEYFTYINTATSRMQNLIKDLLEFSRVGVKISFQQVDCNTLVKGVIADLDQAIKESKAELIIAKLPIVNGNETELKRLFQNLISNAIKFQKPGSTPKINIQTVDNGQEFLFSVQDNGIGIDKKHFDKLFVIFQRLHNTVEYPGTGIGLATCHKIVALHNGKIWIESAVGKGTTFFFTLPK